jgi:protein dithiol:quinone oxidoreductase
MLATLRAHRHAFNASAALCCFAMLGYALYAQAQLGVEPCPLCIFQRVAVFALGIAFVLAALVPDRLRRTGWIAAGLIALAAAIGAGISARHVYIQSLPPGKVPACGANLDFMMEVFPLSEVVRKVLTGSGECAKIDWTFLGVSMPAWVLACVLVLGVAGVLVNWRPRAT